MEKKGFIPEQSDSIEFGEWLSDEIDRRGEEEVMRLFREYMFTQIELYFMRIDRLGVRIHIAYDFDFWGFLSPNFEAFDIILEVDPRWSVDDTISFFKRKIEHYLNEHEEKTLGDQRFIYILKKPKNKKNLPLLHYLPSLYQFLMKDRSTELEDVDVVRIVSDWGEHICFDHPKVPPVVFMNWFRDVLLKHPIIPFKGSRSDLISLLEMIAKEFDVKLSK